MILFLLACGGGFADDTVYPHLQVVATVAEPPEIRPGASSTLTPTIADPEGLGPEVMLWTCTFFGEGCLEGQIPGRGVTIAEPGAALSVEVTAPNQLAKLFEKDLELVLPVLVWTLACAPDVCPVFDAVRAAPEAGSADGDALDELLADPTAFLDEVPLAESSLGFQTLGISFREAPDLVVNPVFVSAPEADVVAGPGVSVPLEFAVDSADVVTAWGYSTAGGFAEQAVEVVDGLVTLTVVGADPAASGDLYVVLTGEAGGSAVWTGTVRPE